MLSFLRSFYYLVFHPTQSIKIFRNNQDDRDEVQRQIQAKKGGYKRQTSCNLWMNQGRVLHPRPAVPAITSTHSCSEVNMLQHIVSPGMHSDKPPTGKSSPKNGNPKKKTLFSSLTKSSPSSKSSVESHEKYIPTNPEDEIDRSATGDTLIQYCDC